MKKPLKTLYIILSAILILIVVVVLVINFSINWVLKTGIETAATRALNVGVSVERVELSIMGGRLGLGNLLVNNPPGYQHDRLLELKDAEIEVSMRSLLSDVVDIKQIKLDGVNVVLEQRGISGNNLQDIIQNISASSAKEEPKKTGKKLHIDNLEISNVTVKVKLLPVPGRADTVELKLTTIKMANLGADDKLDAARLSSKILLAIANGVAEQGVGVLPKEMVNTMRSALDKTMDLGKAVSESGKKIIDAGLEGGKDIGEGISEGIKGLLNPDKKKK